MKWTKRDGTVVNLAIGTCRECGKKLESKRPGDWVGCPCGNFVDTDRWMPERHRFGGNVEPGPYPPKDTQERSDDDL